MTTQTLQQRIDALLPQTQCTRCGYPDCSTYAQAIADGSAAINQCPPGGTSTIAALSELTGTPVMPLDPARGTTRGGDAVAFIIEDDCIGCFKCVGVCPVDAIVGAQKFMHSVLAAQCTGCELCVPVCPTDCITMLARGQDLPKAETLADHWRISYTERSLRLTQDRAARDEAQSLRRSAAMTERAAAFDINAAIEQSRRRRATAQGLTNR